MTHGSYTAFRRAYTNTSERSTKGTRKMHPGLNVIERSEDKIIQLKREIKNHHNKHVNDGVKQHVTFCTQHFYTSSSFASKNPMINAKGNIHQLTGLT